MLLVIVFKAKEILKSIYICIQMIELIKNESLKEDIPTTVKIYKLVFAGT